MITYIGFDHKPLAFVFWGDGKEDKFKTVCYTEEEIEQTLQLKYGDLIPSVVYTMDAKRELESAKK